METKHSTGKWKLSSNPFLHIESGEQWICQLSDIKMKSGISILSDEWEKENEAIAIESVANAKLIAAAPELLEALIEAQKLVQIARQYMPKSIRNSDKFSFENIAANSINSAIQKAIN